MGIYKEHKFNLVYLKTYYAFLTFDFIAWLHIYTCIAIDKSGEAPAIVRGLRLQG